MVNSQVWPHPVTFEVPQDIVSSPLMFLIYVNDIADNVSSSLWLFTDEYLLYRVNKSEEDTFQLHCDLDHLLQWAQAWKMKFNLAKCTAIK